MKWTYDDGGRAEAGYRGHSGDCAVRAIAIATRLPYQHVYDTLNFLAQKERPRRGGKRSNARTGVHKRTVAKYLAALGWQWFATMGIGTGCTVHLREGEIPDGPIVVSVSRHFVAVVGGVVRDTHDPTREGTRCVYGYWYRPEKQS